MSVPDYKAISQWWEQCARYPGCVSVQIDLRVGSSRFSRVQVSTLPRFRTRFLPFLSKTKRQRATRAGTGAFSRNTQIKESWTRQDDRSNHLDSHVLRNCLALQWRVMHVENIWPKITIFFSVSSILRYSTGRTNNKFITSRWVSIEWYIDKFKEKTNYCILRSLVMVREPVTSARG